MRRLLQALGTAAFWFSWPALRLYLNHSQRTRIVIVCGEKVLVVKGWLGNGKWVLPGGGLHAGEDPLQGLLRELREETGVVLEPLEVRPLLQQTYLDIGFRFPCYYFVAELANLPTTRPQRLEISDLQWADWHGLTARNANADVLTGVAAWFRV